ncbi:MAG: hypothetical protein IJC04_05765 [Oscillospiraceae bacterium]|nr:hypothetical protein [Oscillospiraceae bacterium]
MESLVDVLVEFVKKFRFIEFVLSVTIVLAMMIIPTINFLSFIMPLDDRTDWIIFVFCVCLTYLLILLVKKITIYLKERKRQSNEKKKKQAILLQNEEVKNKHQIDLYEMLDETKKIYIDNAFIKKGNVPQRLRIDNDSIIYLIKTNIALYYSDTLENVEDKKNGKYYNSYMCYLSPVIYDYIKNKEDTQNANT